MEKTLLICDHYPLPENIGMNMRTMNFVRFFRDYGTVDVAYSIASPGVESGNPIFNNEFYLQGENSSKRFQKRLLRWINIKDRPLPISRYNEVSEKKLFSIIESEGYDYIFIRYLFYTWSLLKLTGKYKMRTIVDFDDLLSGSLAESEISSANGSFRKFRLKLNQKYLMDYEKKCLNFGASTFCSEKDRLKVVGENDTGNSFIIPNIYHNQSFKDFNFGDGFEKGNNLLFVGNLNYKPNVQGLKWFIESVFSDLKKEYTDTKLLVVGLIPNKMIRNLCESDADIELYSNVPDTKGYYKKCKAVIVPLLTGGGTRIKILEAAMANRPVLSTPTGAEGLDLVDDRDLLLFENVRDFSTQYRKLLKNDKYNSLINNAKNLVLSKYSLQRFNDGMKNVLDRVSYKTIT